MTTGINTTQDLTNNFTPAKGSISFFCNTYETEPFKDQVVNAQYDRPALSSAFQADVTKAEDGKTTNATHALRSFLITLMKREDFKNKLAYLEDTARKQFDVLQGVWQPISNQSSGLIPKFLNNVIATFYPRGAPPNVTTLLEKLLGPSTNNDHQNQSDSLNAILNTKPGDALRSGLEYLRS